MTQHGLLEKQPQVRATKTTSSCVISEKPEKWTQFLIGWMRTAKVQGSGTGLRPHHAVTLLQQQRHQPTVTLYTSLARELKKGDRRWLLEFLSGHGLEILFETLEAANNLKTISAGTEAARNNTRNVSFLSVLLQACCAECISLVMDSEPSLDYIIENEEFIRRFAVALDTDNVAIKKQVVEILSALCVYSTNGYTRVLDILEYYKVFD
ncbi:serine-rich adhesin for platelets [Biomphalaria pfeifferi]|uniref:Serine-rich adhesin for platelets n=1 Tax=Biomphalaria pfeifferi TaxID=112525 RepID=A0AAD8B4F5_BIOPF|nr:serine-rich adhesin for platelets [Biomphalaria pfeifferi]